MSLKENLLSVKNKIISVRDNLIQVLKDKNVEVSEDATLTEVATAVSRIKSDGVDVTLGQIDSNGKFQPLKFDGTTATADGQPETVGSYYSWNGEE
jgi:hypothetical protein